MHSLLSVDKFTACLPGLGLSTPPGSVEASGRSSSCCNTDCSLGSDSPGLPQCCSGCWERTRALLKTLHHYTLSDHASCDLTRTGVRGGCVLGSGGHQGAAWAGVRRGVAVGGEVLRHRGHGGHRGHGEAGDGGAPGGGHAGEPPAGLGVDVLISVGNLKHEKIVTMPGVLRDGQLLMGAYCQQLTSCMVCPAWAVYWLYLWR